MKSKYAAYDVTVAMLTNFMNVSCRNEECVKQKIRRKNANNRSTTYDAL